jgi:hypothetical protein
MCNMCLLLLRRRNSPSNNNKQPQSYDKERLNLSCHEHFLSPAAHHYGLCHFTVLSTQSSENTKDLVDCSLH